MSDIPFLHYCFPPAIILICGSAAFVAVLICLKRRRTRKLFVMFVALYSLIKLRHIKIRLNYIHTIFTLY